MNKSLKKLAEEVEETESWSEEYDKLWVKNPSKQKDIREFIRSFVSQARQEERLRIWSIVDNYLEQVREELDFYNTDRLVLKKEILNELEKESS